MFTEELSRKAEEIDRILYKYSFNKQYPEVLYESMDYSLFSNAKRIRPILVIESCRALNGNASACEPIAVAAEMIHTYSLIHDDLPCMDNDDFRRGKPTNHKVYGFPMALLAGDGLLNTAYEIMFGGYKAAVDKDRYIQACAVLSKAAGVYGMIAGQTADVLNENARPDEPVLDFIHKNKTGALIRACVEAGALCANADSNQFDALSLYGDSIGLMFQIVDDILDIIGDAKQLGKKTGMDAQLSKMTYPYVYGMKASLEKVDELYESSIIALNKIELKTPFLRELAAFLKERKN